MMLLDTEIYLGIYQRNVGGRRQYPADIKSKYRISQHILLRVIFSRMSKALKFCWYNNPLH